MELLVTHGVPAIKYTYDDLLEILGLPPGTRLHFDRGCQSLNTEWKPLWALFDKKEENVPKVCT